MDNSPQVVLLSALSTGGETLNKALRNICSVKWIARKSESRGSSIRLPFHLLREYFRLRAVCLSVPRYKCPIVIVHPIGPDVIPAFAVRKITGCKVILYAAGPDIPTRGKLARTSLVSWAMKNADLVLCANRRVEKKVRDLGGKATRLLPAPLELFVPGIDRRKEFDIITVGRLTDTAKQSLLVEAATYLDPAVRVAIVGEGPEREYLTTLSRRSGRNQVSFLGDLPPQRLSSTLRSSRLYVQCSDEGSSVSALQAAYCGLPIITLRGENPELTEVYDLRSIEPKDRGVISLAATIEDAIENYSSLLADVSRNREALESFANSWPGMALTALFY